MGSTGIFVLILLLALNNLHKDPSNGFALFGACFFSAIIGMNISTIIHTVIKHREKNAVN